MRPVCFDGRITTVDGTTMFFLNALIWLGSLAAFAQALPTLGSPASLGAVPTQSHRTAPVVAYAGGEQHQPPK
jgi:hypothetical protein